MSNVPTNLIPTRVTGLPEYQGTSTLGYMPYIIDGQTFKVQFANIAAVGAVPSSREINSGSGLGGGGDLSANRTLYILPAGVADSMLTTTGVTAGTYGAPDSVPVLTVNAQGRVTAATSAPIVLANYVPTSRTITAGAGLTGGGDLSANRSFAVIFSSTTPEPLGPGSPGVSTVAARGDHVHPAVDLSDTTETQGVLPLSRGGTGNSLSPVVGAIAYSSNDALYLTPTAGTAGQVLVSGGGVAPPFWQTITGTGTVTSVSVTTANGFAGTVANASTVPALTLSTTVSGLLKGNGTEMLAATAGIDYVAPGAYTTSGLTMATARLLGRTTASVGAAEEISVGNGLTLASGSLINAAPDQVVALTGGTAISVTGSYPSFTVTNTAPDQVVSLTGAGTTTVTGTYPSFTITSNDSTAGTVTSVNASGGTTGMSFTGGPITSAGTLTLNGTLAIANGGTGATDAVAALTNLGAYPASNPSGFTSNVGTVTSVSGTGTVSGLSLSGTVTSTGSLTLGGTLAVLPSNFASQTANTVLAAPNGSAGTPTFRAIVAADIPTLNQNTTGTASNVTGIVAVANGGTGASVAGTARTNLLAAGSGANTDITSIALTTGTVSTAPTNGTDIVNKTYADTIASGINFHQAVRLATTTTLPAYIYNNGASGVGATITGVANGALSIDGVAAVVGNRVLIKNEISAAEAYNGVYTVTQVGSGVAVYILTRATDYNTAGSGVNQIDQGDFFLVTAGTTLANTSFVQQTPLPIVVGTTGLTFIQFGAPITYSAGTGLTLAGTVFSITNTGVSASTYGSASSVPVIAINAQGQVTSASNSSISIAGSQITSGTVAIANGGTGATSAPTALTNLGAYPASNPSGFTSNTGTVTSVNLTAGTGVSVSGGPVTTSGSITVTNTAPDQVVSLTGSGATTVTGTYPNFTISSPASGAGTVTSIDVSGGTTGLTTSGGPVTSSGTITLAGTLAIANGGTGAITAPAALTALGAYPATNPSGFTSNTGTVTSVSGTGTVNGITLTGTVTTSGSLTLGGTLSGVSLTSQVTGTLPVANGGTGATTLTANGVLYGSGTSAIAATAVGTTGQVLVGNTGAAPSWSTLSGIGVTSFSAGTTGFTPSTATTGVVTLAGTLNVANGGTGATTLSSGYLLKGNGTSAVSASVVYDNGTNAGVGTTSLGAKWDVKSQINVTSPSNVSMNAVRASNFGYSTGYSALILGSTSGNNTPCINVDPIANASGSFSGLGDEVMFRNGAYFISPNSANTAYNQYLRLIDGYVQFTNSARAPIFYDSDNTSFYLDPNSTSVLSVVRAATIQHSSGNTAIVLNSGTWTQFCDPNGGTKLWLGGTADPNNYYNAGIHYFRNTSSATSMTIDASGIVIATADMRAPIFYDSNNTGFFIDAASTSSLITLLAQNLGVYDSGVANDPYGKIAVTRAADANNYSYYGLTRSGQLGAGFGIDTANRFWWGSATAGYAGVASAIGMTMSMGGTLSVAADVRAPVFYDSNNTAFFFDGANNTNINVLSGNGKTALETADSYLRINQSNTFTNGMWMGNSSFGGGAGTIHLGSAGDPTLSRIRIIGGTYNGSTVITLNGADGTVTGTTGRFQKNQTAGNYTTAALWTESYGTTATGIAFHISGIVGKFLEMRTDQILYWPGTMNADGDFRAPIFYDSNNTAYYLDAASTGTALSTNGILIAGTGTSGGVQNRTYTAGRNRIWSFANADGYGISYFQGGPDYIGLHVSGSASQAGSDFWVSSTGIAQASVSLRAPIFYDSNNTGYYVDPAGSSLVNQIYYAGLYNSADGNYGVVGANGFFDTVNSGYAGDPLELCYVRGSEVRIGTGGGNLPIKASIYYEGTNTAYYVDPDGTSNIYQLTGAITYGSYGSISITGQTNNYAGISFPTKSATLMIGDGSATPAGFYFANSSWGMYCYSNGDLYTRTVYDLDNSAYYVNPASTTNLNVLTTAGNITASGNVTAYSDIRVKDNVETIPSALDKLDQIRGVTYTRTDMDDKERRYAGVIAQEIEAVLPEAIFDNEEYKSVDYNATIGLLIQAVKELRDEVEALRK